MALFDFTKNILDNKPIFVYNYGDMKRDFTYVEDILDGVEIVINNNEIDNSEIFNIGRGRQVDLMHFVRETVKRVPLSNTRVLRPTSTVGSEKCIQTFFKSKVCGSLKDDLIRKLTRR